MKKRVLFIIVVCLLWSLVGINISNAATTEQYKKWSELSDEEKENTIQPRINNINIEDGIKASNLKTYAILKESLESKYCLNEDIKINVKNQLNTSACWAFSTISTLETNIALKTKKDSQMYSTRHMEYATSKTFLDGINKLGFNREVGSGGDFRIGFAYLISGKGPVLESDMPFENNETKINLDSINKNVDKKIVEYEDFPGVFKEYNANGEVNGYTNDYSGINKKTYTDEEIEIFRAKVKQHLKEKGALTAYTYVPSEKEEYLKYFNNQKVANEVVDKYAYYCNDKTNDVNHAVTIVGWDDNFKKENFAVQPKNDGAYIVLNSWGEEVLNSGYYYISYDDVFVENNLMGVSETEEINYDTIYQFDEYGCSYSLPFLNSVTQKDLESIYVANVFERSTENKPNDGKKYEEYINEVSVYVAKTAGVEIYINSQSDDLKGLEKVATAESALEPGYHTIKLASPIKLTGEKFAVAARYSNADGVEVPLEFNFKTNYQISNYWDVVTSNKGESFISPSLEGWTDLTEITLYQDETDVKFKDANVCVKAFSTFEEVKEINVESLSLNEKTKEMQVGDTSNLVVTINPSNATNKEVKWASSNEKVATVSSKGIITALKEGTTTITVTSEDGNKTAKCTVTVKAKTNSEDDKYEVEDDSNSSEITANDSTKNDINDNVTQNKGTTKNSNTKQENDETTAQKILPYAGKMKVIIFIILVSVVGIIVFIRYTKMKDVK